MTKQFYGNRYQVTEKIGIGGMAEVYKAMDTTLGRTVALKVLLPQYAEDTNFAARFRQEAQAAANLQSPYIVNIYDWGRDGESYYIVMEYVRGTDLKTAIGQRGHIHPRKVAEIGSQVCAALSVAHSYGVIHRDIKSANIMVQADGDVKVMDFGIAQAGNAGLTTDDSVLGTAHYVSPEQAQGKELTGASDLYSLGVVMYEAATGQLPFDGDDVVSVALKQVNEQPVPPRQVNPDIDPRLEAIIMRALEKHTDRRFATANEMKTALDNYLTGRGAGSNDATTIIGGTSEAETVLIPNIDRTQVMNTAGGEAVNRDYTRSGSGGSGKKKSKKPLVIVLVIVLLLAGVLGVCYATGAGPFSSKVSVPDVTNMTQEKAVETLESANLKSGSVSYEISADVDKGKVIRTDPVAGESVSAGDTVDLVVSQGSTESQMVEVPNLMGLSAAEAERELAAKGLVGSSTSEENDSIAAGLVCEQSPSANSQALPGSTVNYVISAGKSEETKPVTVVSVRGLSEEDATSTLEDLGLTVKVREGTSSEVGTGEVYNQSIASGTEVTPGTTITIYVSTGNSSSGGGSGSGGTGGDNGDSGDNGSGGDADGGDTDDGTGTGGSTKSSDYE